MSLKSELTDARYAAMTDEEAAADLNTPRIDSNRASMTGREVRAEVVGGESGLAVALDDRQNPRRSGGVDGLFGTGGGGCGQRRHQGKAKGQIAHSGLPSLGPSCARLPEIWFPKYEQSMARARRGDAGLRAVLPASNIQPKILLDLVAPRGEDLCVVCILLPRSNGGVHFLDYGLRTAAFH